LCLHLCLRCGGVRRKPPVPAARPNWLKLKRKTPQSVARSVSKTKRAPFFYKSGPYRKGACKKCMKDARSARSPDWKARDLERKRVADAAYKKRRCQTEQGHAEEKARAKRQMADPIKYEAKKARMCAYYRERKARGIAPSSNAAAKSRRITLARQRIADHKAAHGCRECGERNPLVLDLHHRHPLEKTFTIGQHLNRAWSVLEAEIAKCDVLCCNYHQRHHRDRYMATIRDFLGHRT